MIVKASDFQAEISLGQLEHADVIAVIDEFIEKYEPKYLSRLLGATLADELADAISQPEPEEQWKNLANMVKKPCANYIYYWFQRDSVSATSGSGESETETENAKRVSPIGKMIRAWNEMVDDSISVTEWAGRYFPNMNPDYRSDIFKRINQFGI